MLVRPLPLLNGNFVGLELSMRAKQIITAAVVALVVVVGYNVYQKRQGA